MATQRTRDGLEAYRDEPLPLCHLAVLVAQQPVRCTGTLKGSAAAWRQLSSFHYATFDTSKQP